VRFSRRPANEYSGLCLLVMGGTWKVSVSRGRGEHYESLSANLLINTDVLAGRLREAGLSVSNQHVRLESGFCTITLTPTGKPVPTRHHGVRIRNVMAKYYPMYRGDPIRWEWDIRQYN
jgi:hypothetical protein